MTVEYVLVDNDFISEEPRLSVILESRMPGGTQADIFRPDPDEVGGPLLQHDGVFLQEYAIRSLVFVGGLHVSDLLEIGPVMGKKEFNVFREENPGPDVLEHGNPDILDFFLSPEINDDVHVIEFKTLKIAVKIG